MHYNEKEIIPKKKDERSSKKSHKVYNRIGGRRSDKKEPKSVNLQEKRIERKATKFIEKDI